MTDFKNKVAVITGAASGLGREIANLAAANGMKLVLADIEQQALEAARAQLEANEVEVISVKCDVSQARDVENLARLTYEAFGAVHLLFNNAGVGTGGLIWENTQADWEWVLGVNLWGVIHGVRVFTPLMIETAKKDADYRGHIVNTASVAGLVNSPNMGIYNVSKHAVVSFSETLYQDLQLVNAPISASVLCPFFVQTGISQSQRNRPAELQNPSAPTASQLASEAMIDAAVRGGVLSAARIAELTFDGIRNGQFYIFTHDEMMAEVQARVEDLLQKKNPRDPYAATPAIKKLLHRKLKTATR